MRVHPAGYRSAEVNAVANGLFPVEPEKQECEDKGSVAEVLGFQPNRHHKKHQRGQFQLGKNRRISYDNRGDATGSSVNRRCRRHEEKMAELSGHTPSQVKIEEMALPEDGF